MLRRQDPAYLQEFMSEAIILLCKHHLPYEHTFSVDGLLIMTLDGKSTVKININESIIKQTQAGNKVTYGVTPLKESDLTIKLESANVNQVVQSDTATKSNSGNVDCNMNTVQPSHLPGSGREMPYMGGHMANRGLSNTLTKNLEEDAIEEAYFSDTSIQTIFVFESSDSDVDEEQQRVVPEIKQSPKSPDAQNNESSSSAKTNTQSNVSSSNAHSVPEPTTVDRPNTRDIEIQVTPSVYKDKEKQTSFMARPTQPPSLCSLPLTAEEKLEQVMNIPSGNLFEDEVSQSESIDIFDDPQLDELIFSKPTTEHLSELESVGYMFGSDINNSIQNQLVKDMPDINKAINSILSSDQPLLKLDDINELLENKEALHLSDEGLQKLLKAKNENTLKQKQKEKVLNHNVQMENSKISHGIDTVDDVIIEATLQADMPHQFNDDQNVDDNYDSKDGENIGNEEEGHKKNVQLRRQRKKVGKLVKPHKIIVSFFFYIIYLY